LLNPENLLPVTVQMQMAQQQEELIQLRQKLDAARARNAQLDATVDKLHADLLLADSAIDNLPGMLAYWDNDLLCRFANMQYLTWFGRSHEQMLGIHIQDLMGPELFAKNEGFIRAALRGEDQSFERILIKENGETSYTWARYLTHRGEGEVRGFFAIVLDITEFKKAQLIQAQFADIVASVNDAIISKSIHGVIDSWNPAAERMFGYPKKQMIGQTEAMLMDKERQFEDAMILARVKAGEYIAQWETRRVCQDGRVLDVSVNYSPTHNSEGQLIGVSEVIRDITAHKQFDRMKNEFVSTVSHELRTPLTSIRGALGLISGGALGPVPERMAALMGVAVVNCDRLGLLVNDILDIEKLAAGKFDFDLQRVDLNELITRTIHNDQAFAQKFGVEFHLCSQCGPVFVLADASRIIQVLSNLLSNAAKFSHAGNQVDISINLQEEQVRVEVRDYGIGIDEKFKARIFQKFAQADGSDTRKIQRGSTGLGLAIAKTIIEQHGGCMGYSSELGQGSCFYFMLKQALPN
jgi:PAS domain S-box-containing protein